MASEVKIELIREPTIIRPSSPTPHHLKTIKLSFFDQIIQESYISLILFYPACSSNSTERSNVLKTSLSETLTHLYPLAGKIQCNDSICCDDRGAAFLEAQVNCPISKILDKPDLVMLEQMIPAKLNSTQAVTGHLLLVQANVFECGGLAIGVSMSHKVADACTVSTVIETWAATALGLATSTTSEDHHHVLPPNFGAVASLYPPLDFLNTRYTPNETVTATIDNPITTRRFVFDGSKIAVLKYKAASATVPNPTRVEVVSALIWKCAMEASRSNLGSVRLSKWSQAVNMRKILAEEKSLLGNFVGWLIVKIEESEIDDDHDVKSLVAKLRKGIEEFRVKYGSGVSGEDVFEMFKEFQNLIKRDDIDSYISSSWCRFPLYTANFGSGKPSWIYFLRVPLKNIITLMDARDGDGIEAFLTFKKEDMILIENHKELLAYASLNPSCI